MYKTKLLIKKKNISNLFKCIVFFMKFDRESVNFHVYYNFFKII